MITLEDLIKEVQGHNMQRVFKKDGEPTKDGWVYYDRLTTILYMVKSLVGGVQMSVIGLSADWKRYCSLKAKLQTRQERR